MKKKIIIIIFISILLLMALIMTNFSTSQIELYINWKLILPSIKKNEVLYNDIFMDGDTINILTLKSNKSINKLVSKNDFQIIDSSNRDYVNELLEKTYKKLSDDAVNTYDKLVTEKLNRIISDENNYFLYKTKNVNSSLIMVLDSKKALIYCIISIRQ